MGATPEFENAVRAALLDDARRNKREYAAVDQRSPLWHGARRPTLEVTVADRPDPVSVRVARQTGSRAGAVYGIDPYAKKRGGRLGIVKELLWGGFTCNEATEFGTNLEPVADAGYEAWLHDRAARDEATSYELAHPGFLVTEEHPWLGCSPDAIVWRIDTDGMPHMGVAEYKFPYRQTLYTDPQGVPPAYWAQVQFNAWQAEQFYGVPCEFADFVVATPHAIEFMRFAADPVFQKRLVASMTTFFFEAYLPALEAQARGLLEPGQVMCIHDAQDVEVEYI